MSMTIYGSMIPYNANSPTIEIIVTPVARYECASSSGGKFWEASIVEGTHYNQKVYNLKITYGKLNTPGKTTLTRYSYLKPCKTVLSRKINEKMNKGYYAVTTPIFPTSTLTFGALRVGSVNDIKSLVASTGQDLKNSLPAGAEVIVTVIAGADIIQESFK